MASYDAPLGAVWPPHSAHGVVVSLPLLAHVIGYETGDRDVCAAMTSGYPRFVQHSAVGALASIAQKAVTERVLSPHMAYVVSTANAARALVAFVGGGQVWKAVDVFDINDTSANQVNILTPLYVVGIPAGDSQLLLRAKAFLQHTGARVSSRQAQDALAVITGDSSVLSKEPILEISDAAAADLAVRRALQSALAPAPSAGQPGLSVEDIALTNSGMAAFMAVFGAVGALWWRRWQHSRERGPPQGSTGACGCAPRDLWLQLGWLYLDTAEVISKFGGASGASHCADCDAAAHTSLSDLAASLPPGSVEFDVGKGFVRVFDVTSLAPVRAVLEAVGSRVAAVLTECPTNPLVHSCDLAALRELAHTAGAVLVVDPTVAGLSNASVLPAADIVPVSTTKYAASEGDVMSGAVLLNPRSGFYSELQPLLADAARREDKEAAAYGSQCQDEVVAQAASVLPGEGLDAAHPPQPLLLLRPYARDLCALAVQIQRLAQVVARVNANTAAVARWLASHISGGSAGTGLIRAVHWAYAGSHAANYRGIATCGSDGAPVEKPGCMITFELAATWEADAVEPADGDDKALHAARETALAAFYDACPVVKGPSFGTTFTIMTPFMYLAHFDQASTPAGRAGLRSRGINPYLLRMSVGCEAPGDIVAALQLGLDALAAHLQAKAASLA